MFEKFKSARLEARTIAQRAVAASARPRSARAVCASRDQIVSSRRLIVELLKQWPQRHGKVRPSAFAVFIFIISSYLVGPPPRRPRARCNSNRNDWAQLD